MIIHLSFVSVVVKDQDAALDFYTNKLGFEKRGDRAFKGLPRFLTVAPKGQSEPEIVLVKAGASNVQSHGGHTGMVFRTDQGATTWLLARYDPPNTSIYALVNENFVGRIEVNCRAEGPNETRMRITFTFTMLTEKGEHHVAQQAGPAFQKKMDDWRVWLDEYAVKAGWMK